MVRMVLLVRYSLWRLFTSSNWETPLGNLNYQETADKVVFCRGFIYETRFNKGSDKSDRYNIGVFQQPSRSNYEIGK